MQTRAERRREWLTMAGLLAASLLIRYLLSGIERVVWGDEPFYLWLGRNWLTGRGYSFTGYSDVHHTPLYPLLTGLFYLLTRDMALSSRICYILFGAALGLPIYGIAREMYDRRAGYVTLALLALYPPLTAAVLRWGTLTEPPYYLFVYGGLYMALLALRRNAAWQYVLAGLCFALAYLTRPEAIAYVAVVGIVLAFVRLCERRLLAKETIVGLLLYGAAFALLFLPYAYYTAQHTGYWMVSEKAGVTFVTGIGLSQGDTAAFDRGTWGLDTTGLEVFFFSHESYNVSMLDYIRQYPRQFLGMVHQNAAKFLSSLISFRLFPYFLLPSLGLALFGRAWYKDRAKGELLLAASLTPVLAFLIFFIQDRYIATLLPTLLIWLGLGLRDSGDWLANTASNLSERFMRGLWPKSLQAVPVAAVLLFSLAMTPKTLANTSQGSFRSAHRQAGEWLAEHGAASEEVVMSRYPAIAFHADTRWVPTPNAEFDEIMPYARHKGADYMVVDERETHALRPQLGFLVAAKDVPLELELMHVIESEGETLVIYRILDAGP